MTDLKHCPFCGSKDVEIKRHFITDKYFGYPYWYVLCNECGSKSDSFFEDMKINNDEERITTAQKEAIRAWNRRAEA